ncbi:NAD-binding protein [Fomitiporia mediterranea MF3/22]|uniref:NAD-binding protein n=1 Tax=Fomitiporia mediterranea (strain MF3/22) TaxID=694068 RepID=UPI0004409AF9|nr:NAD-binding protein [Fomitiporia mediterranea MF3/22]EJD00032.1 NAD-binding protein [Fomitiporia mediterranea MF3/22]
MSAKGVAIVTGAAQGIGRGITLRLAADGYDIGINDIPAKKADLEGVAEQIRQQGRKSITIFGDVSKEEDVQKLVRQTVDDLGGLDVMIANAGTAHHGPITEMDVGKWDEVFDVNVKGTMLCYKYAAIQMIKQGRGGRIIGAASTASKQGKANVSVYAASKFAVRGLTQSAAMELGKFGITVNAYAPGPIDTSFLGKFDEYYSALAGQQRGFYTEEWKSKTVVGRIGIPEDVAALVSFLVSKEASFITGQSVSTNGGAYFD